MRHRVLIVEKKKSSCPGGPRSAWSFCGRRCRPSRKWR